MSYRIQQLVAEGFRGYGNRIEFNCSGGAVVLVGPNGWGKTSFFDALTWCLFGRIPRLLGSRDAVGAELIRNRFFPEVSPYVSVTLRNQDEVIVAARDDGGLSIVTDAGELGPSEAEDWIAQLFVRSKSAMSHELDDELGDNPETAFLRSHLLSQDQMVRFLRETNPRDRFDALASLLGLDLVRSFHGHLAEVRKGASELMEERRRRERQTEQRLESLRSEANEIEGLDDGTSPTLEGLLTDYALLRERAGLLGIAPAATDEPVVPDDLGIRANDMSVQGSELDRRSKVRADSLVALIEDFRADSEAQHEARNLADTRHSMEALAEERRRTSAADEETVRRLSERVSATAERLKAEDERRVALASFLRQGLEHLGTDQCPLCGQPIVLDEVKALVSSRLDAVPQMIAALQEQSGLVATELRAAREKLEVSKQGLRETEEQLVELDRAIGAKAIASGKLQDRLIALGIEPSRDVVTKLQEENQKAEAQSGAARSLTEAASLLSKRATSLAAKGRLSNLRDQMKRLETDLQKRRVEVNEARGAHAGAEQVITAARRSERDLVREMFERIEPTMDGLYGRLRPHPVLDRLRLDISSFDERGEVRFVAYSGAADANVTNIFSSAQLNAVAVCIFLAMNVAAVGSTATFALLDDPIQNMDDFNVLGLLDLLRGLLGERQFIVSTHDEQIGELLRRKLRPAGHGDQTVVHRFTAYGSAGPILETTIDTYEELGRVLQAGAHS